MKVQWALSLLFACGGVAAHRQAHSALLSSVFDTNILKKSSANAFVKKSPSATPRFLNRSTAKFAVNGTGIPEVDWDIGESYAGLLPISQNQNETGELFFWFFPTANEEHKDKKEITLWLNGGPGCSSLMALLQDNGPFLWQPGTQKPQPNPWSWNLLTNIVYIEQPISTGFSQGNVSITNDDELSDQFLGFWKNFIETFSMQGWKVYITAESYAGMFAPYIASRMIDANDTTHYDLGGMLIYNGVYFDVNYMFNVAVADYVEQNRNLFAFDDAFMAQIKNTSDHCGYTAWNKKYLRFPPTGPQSLPLPGTSIAPNGTIITNDECANLFYTVYFEAFRVNPCFNIYHITDGCPTPSNPVPLFGGTPYFNRTDVKQAINAPVTVNWMECTLGMPNNTSGNPGANIYGDMSPPSAFRKIPHVIDKTQNVIFAQGSLDYLITTNAVLLGLQNMTWGGKMGFQQEPKDPFYVPRYGYDPTSNADFYGSNLPAGSGVMGTTHTERGFTFVASQLAGHMGPEYGSTGAFRHLEELLGRVNSLSDTEPFTLLQLKNITQLGKPLGNGIVKFTTGSN